MAAAEDLNNKLLILIIVFVSCLVIESFGYVTTISTAPQFYSTQQGHNQQLIKENIEERGK